MAANPAQFAAAVERISLDDDRPRSSIARLQQRGRVLRQEVEHQKIADHDERHANILKESERRRIRTELEAGLAALQRGSPYSVHHKPAGAELSLPTRDAWDALAADLDDR